MALPTFSIRSRIYIGFAVLILASAFIAGFGAMQLNTLRGQIARMEMFNDLVARGKDTQINLYELNRALLQFNFDGDEKAFASAGESENKLLSLMTTATATTKSDFRRVLYQDVLAAVTKVAEKRMEFGPIVRIMNDGRKAIFGAGDALSGKLDAVVDKISVSGRASLASPSSRVQSTGLLLRVAAWRFLATREAAGVPIVRRRVAEVKAAIDAFGVLGVDEEINGYLSALKVSVERYAEIFNVTSSNLLQADTIYRDEIRPTIFAANAAMDKAVRVSR